MLSFVNESSFRILVKATLFNSECSLRTAQASIAARRGAIYSGRSHKSNTSCIRVAAVVYMAAKLILSRMVPRKSGCCSSFFAIPHHPLQEIARVIRVGSRNLSRFMFPRVQNSLDWAIDCGVMHRNTSRLGYNGAITNRSSSEYCLIFEHPQSRPQRSQVSP